MNLTITIISIIKNNFTLSYPNKIHSLKFTFDIFKSNKIYYFKSNFSKKNFLKIFFQKISFQKLNQT